MLHRGLVFLDLLTELTSRGREVAYGSSLKPQRIFNAFRIKCIRIYTRIIIIIALLLFFFQKNLSFMHFNYYHFVPNYCLLFVVLMLYPRPERLKKKKAEKKARKIDAPMYSMDRVNFPFNFLTALLLSKHVLRFLLRFPLTFKPSEL